MQSIKQRFAEEISPAEAAFEGTTARRRAVLTTALAAVLGFVFTAFASRPSAEVQKPLATVAIGGLSTAISGFQPRWVGIGKLSASDTAPSVLVGGFTGGAHCCATLKAIIPDNGRLRVLEFDERDGGPEDTFPKDLDGDGTVDIKLQDDSFRYQFASGAGSWSPPTIFNVYRGQIVNVTTQPGFRGVWEKYAREAREACADRKDTDRNGACAAYVAASARLGRYTEALREAETLAYSGPNLQLPEGCRVDLVNSQCQAGQEIRFQAFIPALSWHLRRKGYID